MKKIINLVMALLLLHTPLAYADVASPQVMIQAKIAETTRNFSRDLGVQWGFSGQSNGQIGNGQVPFQPKPVTNGDLSGVQGLGQPSTSSLIGSLNNAEIEMALRAVEREGNSNVLSQPRVTTLDGQRAEIIIPSGGMKIQDGVEVGRDSRPLLVADPRNEKILEGARAGQENGYHPLRRKPRNPDGFFLGVAGGFAAALLKLKTRDLSGANVTDRQDLAMRGALLGLYMGMNYEMIRDCFFIGWVVAAELWRASGSSKLQGGDSKVSMNLQNNFMAGLRMGVLINTVLTYFVIGPSASRFRIKSTTDTTPAVPNPTGSKTTTVGGVALGVGMETFLNDNLFVGGEARVNLNSRVRLTHLTDKTNPATATRYSGNPHSAGVLVKVGWMFGDNPNRDRGRRSSANRDRGRGQGPGPDNR